jgi:hypothetical protein
VGGLPAAVFEFETCLSRGAFSPWASSEKLGLPQVKLRSFGSSKESDALKLDNVV